MLIEKGYLVNRQGNIYDFYELGFDTYIPISSIHNTGYIELLDSITKDFKEKEEKGFIIQFLLRALRRIPF